MAREDRYVIVYRAFDPVLPDILGDLLRQSGIPARVLGTRSASLIGVGHNIMELNIHVPESLAGEAVELIESFLSDQGDLPDDDDDAADDDEAGGE